MFQITALYAGFLTLVYFALTVRVIRYRRGNQIGLGDGGDKSLLKRIRAQANCAEYAPLGLVMLGLVEAQGTPGFVVHILGLMLLMGRVLHGIGFSASPPKMNLRVLGMFLTLLMLLLSALGLIAHSLF